MRRHGDAANFRRSTARTPHAQRSQQRREEIDFYEGIFADVVDTSEPLTERSVLAALVLAREHGLPALDALHLSLAMAGGCQEFMTTERPGKSRLFNLQSLKVVPIA